MKANRPTGLQTLSCVLALGWGLGLSHPASAAGPYTVTAVDTLGGDRNFANDVSDTGFVTGNSRRAGGSQLFPYVWRAGAVQEIPILPGVPTFGRGFGVNDAGVVAGESGNGPSRAFRYDAATGAITDLGGLPGGNNGGVANDLNNAGRIVGAASNGQTGRAFYSDGTPGGPLIDLGTPLGTPGSTGRAYGISGNNTVAGFARNAADTATEPTLWFPQADGSYLPTSIGTPAGSVFGEAFAVTDDARAVGRYSDPVSGSTRAFFYDGATSRDLPIFADRPLLDNARAKDLNAAGQVVGLIADFDNSPSFGAGGVATLWEAGLPIDLNTLIDAGSGWTLLSAEGINTRGQIVGYGTLAGDTRAFLLTPIPEPASLALLGSGGIALMAGRRTRGLG